MKCLYYLTPTLKSAEEISDDLHKAGIGDWFIHVLNKDESGIQKEHLHSGNYLEKLDILRDGIMGAMMGFGAGLLLAILFGVVKPFGPGVPIIAYLAIIVVITLFGAWAGGLTGVASENKKITTFHDDLEAGKYLFLIYSPKEHEETVKKVMADKHPEAELAAIDANFFNPLTGLKRVTGKKATSP